MAIPEVLNFLKSPFTNAKIIEDVEITINLLIIIDDLKKNEEIVKFSKIILPYLAVEYNKDKFILFSEIFKDKVVISTQDLPNTDEVKELLEKEVELKDYILNLSEINDLFKINLTKKREMYSICSKNISDALINLGKNSLELEFKFEGQKIEPRVDLDKILESRANFDYVINSINTYENISNEIIGSIEPKTEKLVDVLNRKIEDINIDYNRRIDELKLENEKIIGELEPERERRINELKEIQIKQSNEIASKTHGLLVSHLKSEIEVYPEKYDNLISKLSEMKSYDKILPYAFESLNSLKASTNHILDSIDSTLSAISDELLKISEIEDRTKLKIQEINNEIDSRINERKRLLKELINEKDIAIEKEKSLINRVKDATTQCIGTIKGKIKLNNTVKNNNERLLVSAERLKLGDLQPEDKINLKIFRFYLPIYYVVIRNVKKPSERYFIIPPCILPTTIKNIKDHAIYGEKAKWIAVDPFEQAFIDDLINPLMELLEINFQFKSNLNSVTDNELKKEITQSRIYSGLGHLYNHGYLKEKQYKKVKSRVIELFKP